MLAPNKWKGFIWGSNLQKEKVTEQKKVNKQRKKKVIKRNTRVPERTDREALKQKWKEREIDREICSKGHQTDYNENDKKVFCKDRDARIGLILMIKPRN